MHPVMIQFTYIPEVEREQCGGDVVAWSPDFYSASDSSWATPRSALEKFVPV